MNSYFKIYVLLITFFSFSFNPIEFKTGGVKSSEISLIGETSKPSDDLFSDLNSDTLNDFSRLSPITVLNPKSRSAFEKYGVDFTGNCYNCDLAAISINKKHFDIINVCDETDIYRNENFTYKVSKNQLTISTDKNKFIFEKIDDAPVYELKIIGEKISLKKKAFSKFYTQQNRLKKFKQHDCGDFEG